MPHTLRSPSEVELASLHLAFATHTRAPLRSPAFISDEELNFEPLEQSVIECEEEQFALKARLALAAMSTPPAASSVGSSAHSTPNLSYSPYSPDRVGTPSRDGYFHSRPVYADEERPSISPYGANSPALSSGRSSPAQSQSQSGPSSAPATPPVYDSPPYGGQQITELSLAQLNKASIKARGLRLPPRTAAAPTPFPSLTSEGTAKTPLKTVKGFNMGLGLLSSNFEGISLASGGRKAALPALDDLEAPSSPAFKTKPRVSQYAF